MPEKQEVKEKKLKVYAEFEHGKKSYKVGDEFTVPENFIPDAKMEEFRKVSSRQGRSARGKVFYEVIPAKTKDGDETILRHVLPVE